MDGSLYLHVGLKKTGTSYLQSILRASRTELRRQHVVVLPRHEPAGHRLAQAVLDREAAGDALATLPRQLASAAGRTCLITQEKLGRASDDQIARLAPSLAGREIHVVVTVRDIARTIPSAWQQCVKAGQVIRFEDFVGAIVSGAQGGAAESFWLDHGVVDLVRRWSRLTVPSAVHVVIVPAGSAGPELLLERFCSAVGIHPSGLVRDVATPNESLGLAQVELLRRVHEQADRHPRWLHGKVFKREFARGILGAQSGRRLLMPASTRSWCRDYTETVQQALTAGGYDVTGDLSELHPPDSAFTDDPQEVTDADLVAVATEALRSILDERASQVRRSRAERSGR